MTNFITISEAMIYVNREELTAHEEAVLRSCIEAASGLIIEELGADPHHNPIFAKETFDGLKLVCGRLAARLFFQVILESLGVSEGVFGNIKFKNTSAPYFSQLDEFSLRRYRATIMTA